MSAAPESNSTACPPYDARVVANFILYRHREARSEITQLSLYKFLYFAHGWYLVERGGPLVWNNFEAWKNGPVIKAVRDCFAEFRDRPIDRLGSMFDFRTGSVVELPHRLRPSDEVFVGGVIDAYQRYSPEQLSLLTHEKGSPWDRLWKAKEPVGRFGLRLKNNEILLDFLDIVSEAKSAYK
jgi:uncharacterized phage-associated protein